MVLGVSIGREHFENASSDVHGRGIEHGVVIGERNVLEDHAVVIFVERRPAAVLALHGEESSRWRAAPTRADSVRWDDRVREAEADHGGVIDVGIKLVIEFEVPAAGLTFFVFNFPVADGADLFLQRPVGSSSPCADRPRELRSRRAQTAHTQCPILEACTAACGTYRLLRFLVFRIHRERELPADRRANIPDSAGR